MSWHYLQALVADCSEQSCSGGVPSAPSSLTTTASECFCSDSETDGLTPSRSGTTPEPLTDALGVDSWMSSLLGSRVSHSASPASKPEPMTPEICGLAPSESYATWDRDSATWRMSLALFPADISEPYLETWPRAGLMLNGVCYRQPKLERRMSESGCGY